MTLFRYVNRWGQPVAAETSKAWWRFTAHIARHTNGFAKLTIKTYAVTALCDATKLSMETCVLANATGFRVGRRGMFGPACGYVRELANLLPAEAMLDGGIVDYSVGAAPHTGGFVVVHEVNRYKRTQLAYYKLGDGPFYVFYTPFHRVQLPSTIAPPCYITTLPLRHRRPVMRGGRRGQARSEDRGATRWCRRLLCLRADREPLYRTPA